ncbi:hypothetical protein [Candidatus Albibeggiatoa sp. nov. NOAA]|uniref:hypothetical protein n=1 Tax=Candidatus Albibeggiatoa sp. nov. NOAA TaxID=3162724 RepID=UPI0032F5A2F4|nr:hypothetical protein [Thiotrichaceae bacterium]
MSTLLQAKRPKSTKQKSIEAVMDTSDEIAPEKTKRLNANIPASLHAEIKMQAVREDIDIQRLVIKMATEYLQHCKS